MKNREVDDLLIIEPKNPGMPSLHYLETIQAASGIVHMIQKHFQNVVVRISFFFLVSVIVL